MFKTLLAAILLSAGLSAQAKVTVGQQAPDFTLKTTDGSSVSLKDFQAKEGSAGSYVVLEWFNNGCPYVKKHYESRNMQDLQKKYNKDNGVAWLTIVSSAPGQQGFITPELNQKIRKDWEPKSYAMLTDPEGTVGHAYGAKTTPHMFIINPEGKVVYQGAIDDNSSSDPKVAKTAHNYVSDALEALKAKKPVKTASTQPYGCSIKYK